LSAVSAIVKENSLVTKDVAEFSNFVMPVILNVSIDFGCKDVFIPIIEPSRDLSLFVLKHKPLNILEHPRFMESSEDICKQLRFDI